MFTIAWPKSEENVVAEIVHQITSPLVWEVRPPVDWHKEKAVKTIMNEIRAFLRSEQLLTLHLGDDTTSEDAFRIIHRTEG